MYSSIYGTFKADQKIVQQLFKDIFLKLLIKITKIKRGKPLTNNMKHCITSANVGEKGVTQSFPFMCSFNQSSNIYHTEISWHLAETTQCQLDQRLKKQSNSKHTRVMPFQLWMHKFLSFSKSCGKKTCKLQLQFFSIQINIKWT